MKGAFPTGGSLYEISTRPFLYHLSQKYGREMTRLSQIPQEELVEIANKGFEVVW